MSVGRSDRLQRRDRAWTHWWDLGQKSAQKANTLVFASLIGGLRDSLEILDFAKHLDSLCSFPRQRAP